MSPRKTLSRVLGALVLALLVLISVGNILGTLTLLAWQLAGLGLLVLIIALALSKERFPPDG